MSEFTYAILINGKSTNKIIDTLKKGKIEGYLFRANLNWIALTVENDMSQGTKIALRLSKEIDDYIFFFINCEDYGWGFDLYKNGIKKAAMFIDYLKPKSSKVKNTNMNILEEIGGKRDSIDLLESYLTKIENESKLTSDGVEFFKDAFGFNRIKYISFDYFQSSGNIEDYNGTHVEINKKPASIKTLVKRIVEPKLNEMGYTYDKIWSIEWKSNIYVKKVNGFDNALIISKHDFENKLEAKLFSHTRREIDLFFATEGCKKDFKYLNEDDVVNYLKIILDMFVEKGDDWLNENSLKMFDPNKLYDESVDKIFEKYGFLRTSTDENFLVKGYIVYKKNNIQIKFGNESFMAAVNCIVIKDAAERYLSQIIEQNETQEVLKTFGSVFKNEEEYKNLINRNIEYLKKYNILS